MKSFYSILFFVALAVATRGAPDLQRFERPLRVDDSSLATIQTAHSWIRACASEWMPWTFTFEEWRSFRSQAFIASQEIDAAGFREHQQAVAAQLKSHGKTILATLSLTQDKDEFLVVISCAEKLDRNPQRKSDLPSGIQNLLLKKSGGNWQLVDLGTDLAYDSPIVRKMLSITPSDFEVPEGKEPNQPLQRNASTGPFRISSRQLGVAVMRKRESSVLVEELHGLGFLGLDG